ncbi:hypothetical protein D3C74_306680 [compost metagenome]
MLNAFAFQHFRYALGVLDGDRTDEHRLIFLITFYDFFYDCLELTVDALIDDVRHILALVWPVGRHLQHFEAVDFLKFLFLRLRRTSHPGQLAVHPEVVLEGDRGQRHALVLNLDAFFGFNGLVQTVAVTAALHDPAGEFVDDQHFVFRHDVIHVAAHDDVRFERLHYVVVQRNVFMVIQVINAEDAFRFGDPFFGQRNGLNFNVYGVIFFRRQGLYEPVSCIIQLGRFLSLAGNNERRPRFIDENGVHFVNDTKI